MKILIPFRGDSVPQAALPQADRLAKALDGEVVLVALGKFPEIANRRKGKGREPEHKAKEIARMFEGRVRERLEPADDAVHGILQAADEEDPDVIVILPGGFMETDGLDAEDLAEELRLKSRFSVRLIGQEGSD